ncbi:hypothetical protein [Ekhidna sp.]|uniref:hypothetical protein n=1 Tax=Ekhidna sp. TaxID=2608089 RepID=UPI003B506AB8
MAEKKYYYAKEGKQQLIKPKGKLDGYNVVDTLDNTNKSKKTGIPDEPTDSSNDEYKKWEDNRNKLLIETPKKIQSLEKSLKSSKSLETYQFNDGFIYNKVGDQYYVDLEASKLNLKRNGLWVLDGGARLKDEEAVEKSTADRDFLEFTKRFNKEMDESDYKFRHADPRANFNFQSLFFKRVFKDAMTERDRLIDMEVNNKIYIKLPEDEEGKAAKLTALKEKIAEFREKIPELPREKNFISLITNETFPIEDGKEPIKTKFDESVLSSHYAVVNCNDPKLREKLKTTLKESEFTVEKPSVGLVDGLKFLEHVFSQKKIDGSGIYTGKNAIDFLKAENEIIEFIITYLTDKAKDHGKEFKSRWESGWYKKGNDWIDTTLGVSTVLALYSLFVIVGTKPELLEIKQFSKVKLDKLGFSIERLRNELTGKLFSRIELDLTLLRHIIKWLPAEEKKKNDKVGDKEKTKLEDNHFKGKVIFDFEDNEPSKWRLANIKADVSYSKSFKVFENDKTGLTYELNQGAGLDLEGKEIKSATDAFNFYQSSADMNKPPDPNATHEAKKLEDAKTIDKVTTNKLGLNYTKNLNESKSLNAALDGKLVHETVSTFSKETKQLIKSKSDLKISTGLSINQNPKNKKPNPNEFLYSAKLKADYNLKKKNMADAGLEVSIQKGDFSADGSINYNYGMKKINAATAKATYKVSGNTEVSSQYKYGKGPTQETLNSIGFSFKYNKAKVVGSEIDVLSFEPAVNFNIVNNSLDSINYNATFKFAAGYKNSINAKVEFIQNMNKSKRNEGKIYGFVKHALTK